MCHVVYWVEGSEHKVSNQGHLEYFINTSLILNICQFCILICNFMMFHINILYYDNIGLYVTAFAAKRL